MLIGKVVKDLCNLFYDPAYPLIIDESEYYIHALDTPLDRKAAKEQKDRALCQLCIHTVMQMLAT